MQLSTYLGLLDASEEQLMHAFAMLADRHPTESEIKEGCEKQAAWSRSHREVLKPYLEKYGEHKTADPERVRAALFQGIRTGGMGKIRDLHDLSLLINNTSMAYAALHQAAKALRDEDLLHAIDTCSAENDEQAKWVKGHLKIASAQALTVPSDKADELKTLVTKKPSPAGVPGLLWQPLVSGLLVLIVGLISVAAGQAWLFPALGPTAYLQAHSPALPASRWYNTLVGHVIGLLCGIAAVALFHASNDPAVLTTHQLTLGRVGASAVALALTMMFTVLLKADHPPAAATTLLVSLGSFNSMKEYQAVVIGALILAILGEGARQLRLKGSLTPQEKPKADKLWSHPQLRQVGD